MSIAAVAGRAGDAARWREILAWQAWCQLRLESERLYVGYLWWAVEPLLEMGLLYFAFRGLLGSTIEHYVAFLLAGLVAWRWLAQSVTRAAPAILANQPLACQVHVPKILFPLAMMAADAVKFLAGLAVLFVLLAFEGLAPRASLVAFPLVLACEALLIAALGLWLAALVPYFRSLLVGLDVALRFGMVASGVFFDLGRVDGTAGVLLAWNPAAVVLAAWRDVLVAGRMPDFTALAAVAAVSLAGIAGAAVFTARHDLDYPRLPA